jgi:uncharacterized protein (UPF0303 family)
MATTGDRTPDQLLDEEARLTLPSLSEDDAIDVGLRALGLARERQLPVTIEVRRCGRTVFRAAVRGTSADNDDWVARKVRVVERYGHSTLYERVRHEVNGRTFTEATGLPESQYAAHGGGFPLSVVGTGVVGVLVVSGLPQVADHELCVEVLEAHLAGPNG